MTERIIVTGGAGFLGQHLCAALQANGASPYVVRSTECDLTDPRDVGELFDRQAPVDVVYHLAARVGGIGANRAHGADFYRDNVLMDTLVLDACVRSRVGRVVLIGSNCSYPRDAAVPFVEADIFNGYPEATNGPYGIAKRGLLAYFQACHTQHNLAGAYLILANLYGSGAEAGAGSHVIPAMLLKMHEARRDGGPVVLWGTGAASRDFLHVRDAVSAILAATSYSDPMPVNVGSGKEVTIAALARLCAELTDYRGDLVWDASYPDGHPRRCLDITRARSVLGWAPQVEVRDGLSEMWQAMTEREAVA